MGIEDKYFQSDDEARLLKKLNYDDTLNPCCNPISAGTLADAL